MTAPPIPCRFYEGTFHPLSRAENAVRAHYDDGRVYTLAPVEERSRASHSHQFAWLEDAWASLPDLLAERFPTAEHLRKWALIKAGFCDVQEVACASKAEALRWAAILRAREPYSLVIAREGVVRVATAESQSMRSMGRERFQASKDGIIRVISELLEITPDQLIGSTTAREGAGPNKLAPQAA